MDKKKSFTEIIFITDNFRVSDCSENHAKAGALGHRERQSDRRKLLSATMSPMAHACGVAAKSAAGEAQRAGTPKKNPAIYRAGFFIKKGIFIL